MTEKDLVKVVKFINGYYSRELQENEIIALKRELKDFDYETFKNNLEYPLLRKVEYFSVAQLHKIIEDYRELEKMKEHFGIKSFDELYEN